jgi:DNA modification methylase
MRPTLARSDVKLWCADCFDVLPTMKPCSVDLVLADLPYGVTACDWDTMFPLEQLWKHYERLLKPNAAVILTAVQPFTWQLCASKPDWLKYELIWEKPNGTNPLLTKVRPFNVHETILIFSPGTPTYHPQMTYGHACAPGFEDASKTIGAAYTGTGPRKQRLISKHRANTDGSRYPRSIQRFAQERGTGQPTKKPVALMQWLVRSYSNAGDLVLDNTMGYGTTGVACIKERRCFWGIEKSAEQYHVAEAAIRATSQELL